MTHRLHQAIASNLEKDLNQRRVVVWYDPRQEFAGFIDELHPEPDENGLAEVKIGSLVASLLRSTAAGQTSLVALKLRTEPIAGAIYPEPLLIYLPGLAPEREQSPLMELELAGKRWEPQLRREVRRVLSASQSDAAIDTILAPEQLTYADVIPYCTADDTGRHAVSPLRAIFPQKTWSTSEQLLARWISTDQHDQAINERQADAELYALLSTRIGLALDADLPLTKARHHTRRFVLVNEFRDDYQGEEPATLTSIPRPKTKEHRERLTEITAAMRDVSYGSNERKLAHFYAAIADEVEQTTQLANAQLDPAKLGRVDTFRCEERLLLHHAAELVESGRPKAAAAIVAERGVSFWTTDDTQRGSQWELCRRLAALRQVVQEVEQQLAKSPGRPCDWVEAYASQGDGWHRADHAHRSMETWLSSLTDDPDTALAQAVASTRQAYEHTVERMALGFTKALQAAKWSVDGTLHQTAILPKVVEAIQIPTAYLLVDAMRYEMAIDLKRLLSEAADLELTPAVVALPSITPVGMAALLPGAATSFEIIPTKAGLGARVDGHDLANLRDRQRYMKAVRPQSTDLSLDDLITKAPSHIKKVIKDASLVVVRTTDIDSIGESGGLLARQVMEQVVANLARAIRKLAKLGIERFVVTADHGHLFGGERDDGAKIPAPGGETVDLHRRCWIGRGGQVTEAAVRVSAAELGYREDLELAFPRGSGVFLAGGDLAFHHGGVSLQEMIVPVLSGRIAAKQSAAGDGGSEITFHETPTVITNRIFRVRLGVVQNIFADAERAIRIVAIDKKYGEVARTGMASGSRGFDAATGIITLTPGAVADAALMLTNDQATALRVVVLDAHTDAELGSTAELPVKLGI